MRCAKHADRRTASLAEQSLGALQLSVHLRRAGKREDAVVVAMVAELVPLAHDSLDELRMALGVLAEHEERGPNTLGTEDVEDARRRVRRRPIIERQRNDILPDALAIDDAAEQRRAGTEHPPRTEREQQDSRDIDDPGQPRQVHVREHRIGEDGDRSDGHSDQHCPEDRLTLRHGRGPLSRRST